MKTKTLKKALSLFLAVLMIALAIPFTLLTVAAEEATEIEIVDFAVFGKYNSEEDEANDKTIYFQSKAQASYAYDEKLSDKDYTYAQTKGFKDIEYKMCYFDDIK